MIEEKRVLREEGKGLTIKNNYIQFFLHIKNKTCTIRNIYVWQMFGGLEFEEIPVLHNKSNFSVIMLPSLFFKIIFLWYNFNNYNS